MYYNFIWLFDSVQRTYISVHVQWIPIGNGNVSSFSLSFIAYSGVTQYASNLSSQYFRKEANLSFNGTKSSIELTSLIR